MHTLGEHPIHRVKCVYAEGPRVEIGRTGMVVGDSIRAGRDGDSPRDGTLFASSSVPAFKTGETVTFGVPWLSEHHELTLTFPLGWIRRSEPCRAARSGIGDIGGCRALALCRAGRQPRTRATAMPACRWWRIGLGARLNKGSDEGEFRNVMRTDEWRYEGRWCDGKRHGRGVETFSDGGRYEGEWRGGLRHGPGVFYWNGSRHEGEYRHGKLHEHYVMTFADGQPHGQPPSHPASLRGTDPP